MLFEKTMLKRIPQYEADGILDSANATRLTEHLKKSVQTEKSYFISAIYFAGVILLLVSACLFVVNVWDNLDIVQKLVIAFVPLVLSGIFGAVVIAKNWGVLLSESAGICNIVSFGFMLTVVANTLGLPPNAKAFLMLLITFGLIAVYIFKSNIVAGGIAILTAILLGEFRREIPTTFDMFFVLIAFTLICIFTAKNWKKSTILQRILGLVVCICALVASSGFVKMLLNYGCVDYVSGWYVPETSGIIVYALASILLLSASFGRFANLEFYRLPHLYVGIVVLSFTFGSINFSSEFSDIGRGYSSLIKRYPDTSITMFIVLVCVVSVVYLVMVYKALRAENKHLGMVVLSLMFPLYMIIYFTEAKAFLPYMLIVNVLYFVSAGLFIYAGVKKRDYLFGNIGIGMLICQSAIRLFNSDVEILARAIFFAICGILVIVINRIISKRKGGRDEE